MSDGAKYNGGKYSRESQRSKQWRLLLKVARGVIFHVLMEKVSAETPMWRDSYGISGKGILPGETTVCKGPG